MTNRPRRIVLNSRSGTLYTSATPTTLPRSSITGTYTSARTAWLARSEACSRLASGLISTETSPASASWSSRLSGKRRPISSALSDHTTVAVRSHILTRTTSGRLVNSRETSAPRAAETPSAPASNTSHRPFIRTSRWTSAAVFFHSQSDTAWVSSEDSARPMTTARATTQPNASSANRLNRCCFISDPRPTRMRGRGNRHPRLVFGGSNLAGRAGPGQRKCVGQHFHAGRRHSFAHRGLQRKRDAGSQHLGGRDTDCECPGRGRDLDEPDLDSEPVDGRAGRDTELHGDVGRGRADRDGDVQGRRNLPGGGDARQRERVAHHRNAIDAGRGNSSPHRGVQRKRNVRGQYLTSSDTDG